MKRKLPDHIPGTVKQWRARKRRELKAVMSALDTFRLGCAYTPVNYFVIDDLEKTLTSMAQAMKGHWTP